MTHMFGASFVRAYGNEPNSAWIRAASTLTDKQCRKGLEAVMNDGYKYAPSLPGFVALCRGTNKGGRHLGVPETVAGIQGRVEAKKGCKETAGRELAKMRAILGVNKS